MPASTSVKNTIFPTQVFKIPEPTKQELMSGLYRERQVRDELKEELSVLKREMPLASGEDEERCRLMTELYRLEVENEKLEMEKEEESIEELEDNVALLKIDIQKQLELLRKEEVLFAKKQSLEMAKLLRLKMEMKSIEKETKKCQLENEGLKVCVMSTTPKEQHKLMMELYKLKFQEQFSMDGTVMLDRMKDEHADILDMISLLEEICNEHYRPKELEKAAKQIKENEEAMCMMFADMDLESNKENIPLK